LQLAQIVFFNGTTNFTATILSTGEVVPIAPPSIAKSFGTSPINVGSTSLLSIVVTNPNSSTALTGVGYTDTLPTGLTVPDLAPVSQCGGTASIASNVITLSGATVAASLTCTVSVNVTANGAATGVIPNNTSTVTSTNGGTGNSASANITVNPPVLKYKTRQSGDWNDFNTWQVDSGSGFVPATSGQTPTSADDSINIQGGHTVTLTADVTADQLIVSGTLNVNSGKTLTLNDGTGTDCLVNSTVNVLGNGVIAGAGTIAITGTLGIGSTDATDGLAANVSASLTLNPPSTVNFNGTGAQTVGARDYYALTVTDRTSAVTFGSGTVGILGSFNPASGNVTYAFNSSNTIEYKLLTVTGSSTTILPLLFTHYNSLKSNEPGNTVGPSGLVVDAILEVAQGTFTSASDYNNVTIDSGATLALAGPITVSGNWTNNGTFTANGFSVTFDGSSAQSIGGSDSTAFATLAISNTGSTVTLTQDVSDTTLNLTSGTFDQGASFNVTSGSVTVSAGANWHNIGTGDLQLSGNVANSGTITFNANGLGCPQTDDISITSNVNGTQRAWSGTGTFSMTDVTVRDQGGTSTIVVQSGASVSGNGLNWVFVNTCSAYTWTDTTNTHDWTNPLNWSPTRTTPGSSDILIFGSGTPAPTVTNVAGATGGASETIAELHINNSSPTFSSPGTTLTINAGAGVTGLDVSNAFPWALSGSNALVIQLGSGTLGKIQGTMTMAGGGHKLISNDAGGITFLNLSNFTTTTGFIDFPFGDGDPGQGAVGSVIFQNGSFYNHNAGSSPFGAAGNGPIVTFQTGSTARWFTSSGFQASGRTYANLEIGSASGAVSVSDSGTGAFTFDSLTINSTPSVSSSLTYNGTGSASATIKGDITSNGVGNGTLPDVTLIVPGGFTIARTGGGTITFGNDGNSARSVSLDGNGSVPSGTTLQLNRILQLGSVNVNTKTLSVNVDGVLNGGSTGYVVGSLQKSFSSPSVTSQTFQVGTVNGYAPIEVANASGTGSLKISSTGAKLSAISGTNALSRYWTISNSGLSQADLTFHYKAGDIPGTATESNFKFFRYNGSFTQFNPSAAIDTTNHIATLNGVTQFSDWTLAEPAAINGGTLSFSGAPYTTTEGNGASHLVTITVSRTGGSDGSVTAHYQTSDGTATAGSDYVATSGDLTWPAGDTTDRIFTITVNEDTTYEANETVNITLSTTSVGAAIGGTNPTTLTINNDDAPPTALVVNNAADTDDGFCTTDPGGCTLREAVNAANSDPDTNTITFNIPLIDPGCNGGAGPCTITLTSGTEIQILNNLNVSGPDARKIVIDGGAGTNRIFYIGPYAVAISGVTMQHGHGGGGGTSGVGGAIYLAGNPTGGGSLTLDSVLVQNNTAATSAGGVYFGLGATQRIINSTITGNSSLQCGGLFKSSSDHLYMANSTVSNNSATNGGLAGGGLCDFGSGMVVRNSTITNNHANTGGWGGGILLNGSTLNIGNTIVAGNSVSGGGSIGPDFFGSGSITSAGYNLIGNNSQVTSTFPTGTPNGNNDWVGDSSTPLNPQLASLADNGGTTPTHALNSNSVAVDHGSNALTVDPFDSSALSFDQRGAGFPRQVDGNSDSTATVDIGAYEAPACTTPPATPTPSNGGPYCEGGTISLSTPFVSGATYDWTGPNSFTSSQQNPTRANATTADAGTYSVTITVAGCASAPGTTNVVVNPTPATPTASNGGPYCEGGTIALSTPFVSGATYAWAGPNGFTSAQQNPTRANATIADAGTYSVALTVNGCTSAAGTTNVVVNPTPATPTATNGGPYCEGATISLFTPTVSGATYAWTGPNGFTSALQNPTRSNATTNDAGTYSVTITVNGCTSAAGTTDVVVNTIPATPTPSNFGPYCEGATIALSTPFVSGATYAWTGPNGFTSSQQNPTRANATTADGGTYSVTITVNGCTSAAGTTNVVVNVCNSDLSIAKSAPASVTEGNDFTYAITVSNSVSATATATGVSVTDVLPAGVTFVSATAGCVNNTGTITCTGSDLAAGNSETFKISVITGSPATVANTASASATNDPNSPHTSNTTSTTINAAVCAAPPAGMIAWWPAEGNGKDVMGPTAEDGALVNGLGFAPGKVGQAFNFDGVDDYVEVPDSAGVDLTRAISIDAWVKPNVSADQIIVSKYDTAQVPEKVSYLLSLTSSGKVSWNVYGGTDFRGVETDDGAVATGTFTHIAATFDPSNQAMKIYVNGVATAATLRGGSASISAINNTDVPLRLGVARSGSINNFTGFFSGLLDEVELFNTAISASDVAAIYDASLAGKCVTPEIDLQGSGNPITDGSTSPSATNGTDFGNVTVGGNVTHTFTIYNTGSAKLDITGITKTGTNESDFSIGSLTPASPILSGGSATFTVTFAPTATGARTATIHIANNDSDEGDYDFVVQGGGAPVPPDIAVEEPAGNNLNTGDSDDFGNQTVGTTSSAKTFTIKNDGGSTLTISSISNDGSNPTEFNIDQTGTSPTVAPGGNTTFKVTFTPGDGHSRTATLHIVTDDPDESSFDLYLSGTGTFPETLVVTKTEDSDNVCLPGNCSLREAINAANENEDANTITFAIPANDPGHVYYKDDGVPKVTPANVTPTSVTDDANLPNDTGNPLKVDDDYKSSWWRIKPLSALPEINSAMTIDGYTQEASTPLAASRNTKSLNDALNGDDAVLRIELDGEAIDDFADGFDLFSNDSCTISGLVINNFSGADIYVEDGGGDIFSGNFIGVDVSGTLADGTSATGIYIDSGDWSTVGGDDPGDRNLISGRLGDESAGVVIFTDYTSVEGNFIGTDRTGKLEIPNSVGILIGGDGNFIGCEVPDGDNVISGNQGEGVVISDGGGNLVEGNFIGTDNTGQKARPNSDGIKLAGFFAQGNFIGISGFPNTISGNGRIDPDTQQIIGGQGIEITDSSSLNIVESNLIGVAFDGTTELGNLLNGVEVYQGAVDNIIGPGFFCDCTGKAQDNSSRTKSKAKTNQATTNQATAKQASERQAKLEQAKANQAKAHQTRANQAKANQVKMALGKGSQAQANNAKASSSTRRTVNDLLDGGNVIAFNGLDGVRVTNSSDVNNVITQNSIYSNTGLGINLVADGDPPSGVTLNDACDTDDPGPNHLQNFPALLSANVATQTITGKLNSTFGGSDYVIEFFVNPASSCDSPSNHGEGKLFIGSTTTGQITDEETCEVGFNFNQPLSNFSAGDIITATATNSGGNTSEFSECFVVPTTATTTAITNASSLSTTSSTFNAPFTVQWNVTSSGSGTITGTVTVSVASSTESCTASIGDGQCQITPTSAGTKQLTATYSGDSNFTGSSSSPAVSHAVDKASTTTTISNASSLSTTPSNVGQALTVQWNVASTPAGATGSVSVTIDGNPGCSAMVSAGQCDVTPSTSGTKSLVAHYGGDGNFLLSDSSPVNHVVNPPLISGHVDYCITPSDNVPGVIISVTGSQTTSTTTGSSGNYSINLSEGGNYTLTPTKTALSPLAPGIDTADVVGAQRQFLGLAPLNGCALTAADANEDSTIDTVDAIAIQHFFLGSGSTGHVGEWQFNPANRPYSNLATSQSAQDYDALVVGDITGDVTPSIANREGRNSTAAHPLIPSAVTTVSLPIGNISTNVSNFTLAVTTSNIDPADNLVGFQGDFTFDSSVVTFQATPASPAGLTASNWNVSANILGAGTIKTLRISAFSNTSTPLSGSGTLFNLNFTRVSNSVGANTTLSWAQSPNNFVFIDTQLVKQSPASTPDGKITVVGPTAANGNISGQILDSAGAPVEGAAVQMSGTQNRLTITDAQGNYHFDDVETNGLYVVTPSRSNFTFSPAQRAFSQLGAHTEATFTGAASANGLNPLDTTEYFVRQQYLDFLGREPDDAGFNFWVNNIDSCGADSGCREAKRVDTSAAFFLSIEFQQTGYLVYRAYESAYGNLNGAPVPMKLSDFKPDTREISNGVVVLQDGWQQKLENNKRAFITEFAQRPRFTNAYPVSMTPAQFVDKLFANAQVPSTDPDYAAALTEFGAASDTSDVAARARVLRRVAENSTLTRQQFNQAFVLMQYFGYLLRDPNSGRDVDFTGYNFWLEKLNHFSGNFENAEMVKAFLSSVEYRGRFPR